MPYLTTIERVTKYRWPKRRCRNHACQRAPCTTVVESKHLETHADRHWSVAARQQREDVSTVRVLLFLLGVLMVATYVIVGAEIPAESRQELIPYIVAVSGAWALTFLIPGAIALLVRSRDRE